MLFSQISSQQDPLIKVLLYWGVIMYNYSFIIIVVIIIVIIIIVVIGLVLRLELSLHVSETPLKEQDLWLLGLVES